MSELKKLFEGNRAWSQRIKANDPTFFSELSKQQSPEYLWIGCSDSRVPANQIVGLLPGQVFVHRNVANLVWHSDLNCLSVLQYAVEVLRVKHIIVCGHYGCGGVRAALEGAQLGLIDNWLMNVREVYREHRTELNSIDDFDARHNRLCELNVMHQVQHVARTTVVQQAWREGHEVQIHGLVYGLSDGLLRNLSVTLSKESSFGV